jgi:hypothetical protein
MAPGIVLPVGWDRNTVAAGTPANTITDAYTFNIPVGGLFRATLCWDSPEAIANAGAGNTYQNGGTVATLSTFTRNMLTDLDLYLFSLNGDNSLGQNIDYSTSDIDNEEYLYVPNLPAGSYQIDVVNAQFATPADTTYGLAWSVPEPTALGLLLIPAVFGLGRRATRRQV